MIALGVHTMKNVRWNILGLAFIGAVFVAVLGFATGGSPDAQLATLAVAGTLVGGLSGTMTRLVEPDPDPSVPASVVEHILQYVGASTPPELTAASAAEEPSPMRWNVIWLAIIAAVIVGVLTFILDTEAALVTVAGGFVGGLVSIAGELVKPPPNPSVPASVVLRLIDGTPKDRLFGAS